MAQKILYDRQKRNEAEMKAECKVRLLEADVRILEQQTQQQIKEMELINWYTQVMEQGIDAKAAMKNYLDCKKQLAESEKQRKDEVKRHEDQVAELKSKIANLQDQLKKQHFEVTKPLIQEV